jgi:hypothetical protein
MVKIFLFITTEINKYEMEIYRKTREKRTEILWNVFRIKGIGGIGLSETKVNELKKLLEEICDKGRLDAIDKAINNYKIRELKNKENQNSESNDTSNVKLSKKWKHAYSYF